MQASDEQERSAVAYDFTSKVALVTASSQGIGFGVATAFARAGAAVVLCGRSEGPLERAASALEADGHAVLAVRGDLRDAAALDSLFGRTVERFGGLDVLVNNAGGSFADTFKRAPVLELSAEDLLESYRLNVVTNVSCIQRAVPLMRRRGGGAIVNITSRASQGAGGSFAAYGAAKSAMDQLTRALAEEVAPEIRVNAVAPGPILTERTAGDHVGGHLEASLMMGRIGLPSDVAELVLFLASPAASWITGSVVRLDGGTKLVRS